MLYKFICEFWELVAGNKVTFYAVLCDIDETDGATGRAVSPHCKCQCCCGNHERGSKGIGQ